MLFERRTPRDVLRDKRGISASIPEALAGVALKAIIIAAVGGLLAGGIAFWAQATASAETSSGFQNASVAFEKAVQEADVVVGTNANRVGLLRNLPNGTCEVQTWQARSHDGAVGLQVDIAAKAGVCAPTTKLHAAGSAKDSKEILFNIATPAFTYANLGGRAVAFNATGAGTLATGTKPAGTKKANWEDTRPYKVTMSLQSRNADTSAAAQKSVTTAYTNVVTITEAEDDLRYVPTPSTDPIPGPVKITSLTRSNVEGKDVGGGKEGVAVSFTGAVCKALPTKVTVSYAQQSPTAAAAVSSIIKAPRDGSQVTVHLGKVPNGSTGEVTVSAVCVEGGAASTDNGSFTQALPTPATTVTQGTAANKHDVRWTAVSSLPTTYTVTKSAAFGTELDAPHVTSALTRTYTYAQGTTFANRTDYSVVASVGGDEVPASSASITTPWPATPAATGIKWTHTGTSPKIQKGVVKWNFDATCPAGTTLQSRVLENRTGQANGTYDTTAKATTAYTVNGKSYTWDPDYALQGYSYGVRVDSYCDSNVTPFNSAVQNVQSPYFTTPMAQPAKPVWDAYNHREMQRGTDRTWSTCFYGWEQPVCPTMTIDYKTYCSPGSWVGWSNYTSSALSGSYNHAFGWKDYWHVAGLTTMAATYSNPVYQCFTPWVDNTGPDTPENPRALTSPAGNSKVVTVWRVWPY